MATYKDLILQHCAEIVEQVLDNTERYRVGAGKIPVPKEPILYRWWFPANSEVVTMLSEWKGKDSKKPINLLEGVLTREIEGKTYYALYFGKSNNGYRRYIQHSTGNVHISTLRRTLYGLCLTENGEKQYIKEREEEITRMLQECYYEWIPFENEDKLVECVESICIALGKYPLNVDGNPAISNQWRDYLLEKRKLKE